MNAPSHACSDYAPTTKRGPLPTSEPPATVKGTSTIIYGSGACATACFDHLAAANIRVAHFLNSFAEGSCCGLPVIRFDPRSADRYGGGSLVVASMHWIEIVLELARAGLRCFSVYDLKRRVISGPAVCDGDLAALLRVPELVPLLRESIIAFLTKHHAHLAADGNALVRVFDVLFTHVDYLPIRTHAVALWTEIYSTTHRARQAARKPRRLVIYDTIFPSPLGTCMWEEFVAYLHAIPDCSIYTSGSDFSQVTTQDDYLRTFTGLFQEHPIATGKVHPFTGNIPLGPDTLFYCIFLRTIHRFIDVLEATSTPFAFTLYSGGEFGMGHEHSDLMLRRVCSSPCFRKVIVGQHPIRDYLLAGGLTTDDKIEFIYSPVARVDFVRRHRRTKKFFPRDKATFDTCFIAHRSPTLPHGENKGYDIYIETMRILAREFPFLRCHVFGSWDETVMPVQDFRDRITFHGPQPLDALLHQYQQCDLILSPSRPNVLVRGDLDGAPNVATVEAGVAGLAVFITDQLGQCRKYETGKHLEIIPEDPRAIAERIRAYIREPERLQQMAACGQARLEEVHGYDGQLKPRIRLLTQLLHE